MSRLNRMVGPPLERILARIEIDQESGCWIYPKAAKNGYAVLSTGLRGDGSRRTKYAHRIAYEEMVGPIPDTYTIDHLCRVRTCVNPDHLEPVTSAENVRRATPYLVTGPRPTVRPDACKYGHPYSGYNARARPEGGLVCRECARIRTNDLRRLRLEKIGPEVKINLPADLIATIDKQARGAGKSRNELIRSVLESTFRPTN